MKLRVIWGSRRARPPLVPALVGAVTLLLILGTLHWHADGRLDAGYRLCNFHRVTGQPCPTCGTTRASLALLRADFPRALQLNPLYTAIILAALPYLLLHYACGLRIRLEPPPRRRRGFWLIFITAVVANWAYLCLAGI